MHVGVEDGLRIGKGLNSARNAVLSDQVQRRVGRAVGIVGNIVYRRASKLIIRMKTRDLQRTLQTQLIQRQICMV